MRDKRRYNKTLRLLQGFCLLCLCHIPFSVNSLTFSLPTEGDIVGVIQMVKVRQGESLGEIGRRYDVGVYEMIEANPELDPWVPPPGAVAVIPSQFILPSGPREGLILNLAEMRLYYYHTDKPLVSTYPIGIGKGRQNGWSTPLVETKVIGKKKNPDWHPPESIRQEHLKKGDVLPAVVKAGPDNPLGAYAFYLELKGYLIHGSNRPGGVGVRSSHGCIRLLPEDIESLFYAMPVGTKLRIIHEPYKVGWHQNRLYLEAHQPLQEGIYAGTSSLEHLEKNLQAVIKDSHLVNWTGAQLIAKSANGYPSRID